MQERRERGGHDGKTGPAWELNRGSNSWLGMMGSNAEQATKSKAKPALYLIGLILTTQSTQTPQHLLQN